MLHHKTSMISYMPTPRQTRSTRPPPNRHSRSQLLEACIDSLHALNFQIYASYAVFKGAEIVSPRYVIRNFPHASPYGTPGKKEGLAVSAEAAPGYFQSDDDGVRVVVEAKFQDSSGSVDEKIPFIWEGFLDSPILNWVVVFYGRYWKTGRGREAVKWLKARADKGLPGRQMHVVNREGLP